MAEEHFPVFACQGVYCLADHPSLFCALHILRRMVRTWYVQNIVLQRERLSGLTQFIFGLMSGYRPEPAFHMTRS